MEWALRAKRDEKRRRGGVRALTRKWVGYATPLVIPRFDMPVFRFRGTN